MCVQCIELNLTTSGITQVEYYLSDHSRGLWSIFCSLSCPRCLTWPVWRGRTSQIRHTSQIRAAPPFVAFDSVSSMHRQEHMQSQYTTYKASTSELKTVDLSLQCKFDTIEGCWTCFHVVTRTVVLLNEYVQQLCRRYNVHTVLIANLYCFQYMTHCLTIQCLYLGSRICDLCLLTMI